MGTRSISARALANKGRAPEGSARAWLQHLQKAVHCMGRAHLAAATKDNTMSPRIH